MAKKKVSYECMACGYESAKYLGKCPNCGAWNQMEEQIVQSTIKTEKSQFKVLTQRGEDANRAQRLEEITYKAETRTHTNFQEFDRVLGGGVVAGSLVLIGGDPGIGKSTLLLQVSIQLANLGQTVLYVSGEESLSQIKMRAERLSLKDSHFYLLSETDLAVIAGEVQRIAPDILIIDSIQTMQLADHTGVAGSVSQLREATAILMRIAKDNNIATFIVGHVTKEGNIAGPRMLEHMVDTVLYFEGDQHSNYRMIRAIKNRFGAANELGVFAMTEQGLKGVSNPSAIFLASWRDDVAGSCVLVTQEGSRPLLVEIQALVDDAHGFTPKRLSVGLEQNRLAMLLAVLNRHAGIACFDQDVFLNAVGGVKIGEPASDLAVILAMVSSFRNKPLPEKMVVFGEIGLSGEVRPVSRGQERLKEAEKLGFKRAIVPKANLPRNAKEFPNLQIYGVERLDEAVQLCRDLAE